MVQKGVRYGSGTVAGTALRVLCTTVPDPLLSHAEAVARVGVGHAADSQPDGAARVAGHIEVVSAPADDGSRHLALLGVLVVYLLVTALGIEAINHKLPTKSSRFQRACYLFRIDFHSNGYS